jgi:hypothetical protein
VPTNVRRLRTAVECTYVLVTSQASEHVQAAKQPESNRRSSAVLARCAVLQAEMHTNSMCRHSMIVQLAVYVTASMQAQHGGTASQSGCESACAAGR